VLCSGGLDSIVLTADLASTTGVQPLYVASGLAWERAELEALAAVLRLLPQAPRLRPVTMLHVPLADLYPATHWALTGAPPGYDTPDEDVYLPGRNITLLGKAAVYCAMHGIGRICLAPLAGNPFPDATPAFFETMGRALSIGLATTITIEAPYRTWTKADVVRRGAALGVPLDRTVSCMNPEGLVHCGACSKCRERHDAFQEALGVDPTAYRQVAAGR
jgi:7-cyano-7-deazaguanine synthase